jgi:hypothetical protein
MCGIEALIRSQIEALHVAPTPPSSVAMSRLGSLAGSWIAFLRHRMAPGPSFGCSFKLAISVCNPWALTVYCLVFACIWGIWKAKQKGPLTDLPGPPPESFFLGMTYSMPPMTEAQN